MHPTEKKLRRAVDAFMSDNLPEAERILAQINRKQPPHFDALNLISIILMIQNRFGEAEQQIKRALALNKQNDQTLSNYGLILKSLNRPTEALDWFTRSLAINPKNPVTWHNRGTVLFELLNRYSDAIEDFDKAITYDPGFAAAISSKGNCLSRLLRHDEALAAFDKALSIKPDIEDAWLGRGVVFFALNRDAEALKCFDKALEINGQSAEAHLNKAFVKLSLGDYEEGWRLNEWRWKARNSRSINRNFAQPLWLNDFDIREKRLLIHAEQGLGDTIQFSRYVKLLMDTGATITFEVQEPLVSLFKSQGWNCNVIAQGDALPLFDVHCPLISLPLAFKTTVNTIPRESPYLSDDSMTAPRWAEQFQTSQDRRKIGVVWSGSSINVHRSIKLHEFSSLISRHDANWYAIQKDIKIDDREYLEKTAAITDLSDRLSSFNNTASIIKQLDLVISVDTSVAHLAGAMGKPVWILLPFHPDFRWLRETTESPWYPSARLYRQTRDGDWTDVLEAVARDLNAR
jgi:tetratricopeptide (TPR) repeat protein